MKAGKKSLSLIVYTCFLKTCFTTRHFTEAEVIYNEIKNKFEFDEITYKTLIKGFLSEMMNLLMQTLKECLERKMVIEKGKDLILYDKIYKAFYNDSKYGGFVNDYLNMLANIGIKRSIKTGYFFFTKSKVLDTEFEEDDIVDKKPSNYLISAYKYKKHEKKNLDINVNEMIFRDEPSLEVINKTCKTTKEMKNIPFKDKVNILQVEDGFTNTNYKPKSKKVPYQSFSKYEDPSQYKIVKGSNFKSNKFGRNDENNDIINFSSGKR